MNKNEFMNTYGPLVGAIDEGTSSARFLVFAANTAEVLTYHQVAISQSCPKEGWVEQDAKEILAAVQECLKQTVFNLQQLTIDPSDIVALGITNQRETTVVWDSQTGEPLYNAIGGGYAAWKRKLQAIYNVFTLLGVILRWSREVAVKFDQKVLLRF